MTPDRFRWVIWLVLLLPIVGLAHKSSDSYLTLDLRETPPQLRWDIALADLEQAIGLDQNGDRTLTWAEVQRRHEAITAYAAGRLAITADDIPCVLRAGPQQLADHIDGTYTVLPASVQCPRSRLTRLQYDLLFDVDPTHRGILRVLSEQGEQLHVVSPDNRIVRLDPRQGSDAQRVFTAYLADGVWHIWMGLDHLLFLLTLLLPIVLHDPRHTEKTVKSTGRDVLSVVTAFTIAHSITLALAVIQVITLPSQWVESAIAATVLLAAVHNVHPYLPGRRWAIAFALGLVHGIGFASALIDVDLSTTSIAVALGGFNLGVELGQIGIIVLLLPIAHFFHNHRLYRVAVVQLGSAIIATIALFWLVERSLNLQLIPL